MFSPLLKKLTEPDSVRKRGQMNISAAQRKAPRMFSPHQKLDPSDTLF